MNNNNILKIKSYFSEVKLSETYNPYFCSVEDAITIVIVGTFCGFRNLKQIHQWADHDKIRLILREHFGVANVLTYCWITKLLKIIDPKSMNDCFINWVTSILPDKLEGCTVALDGKTVCSTTNMEKYKNPLHIVSAQIAEIGITLAQEAVEGKSNEIPATQRLIKMLKIKGCIVTADALNCQKETAKLIIKQGAHYLLSVKNNHKNLKEDIEDYVQDAGLREKMSSSSITEKNRNRIEKRTAFVTSNIDWIDYKEDWVKLKTIGAIHTSFTMKSSTTEQWHYYISSKPLSPEDLLRHARGEWSVETMHWLLDVHFAEDDCRVQDENTQKVLNMIRKIIINCLRTYKNKTNSQKAFSNIMLDCLIEPTLILEIINTTY